MSLSPSARCSLRVRGLGVSLALCAATASLAAQDSAALRADSVGRRRIQPLPALGSAPETGLQFGATLLGVWEPSARRQARPTSLLASVLRTRKQQTRVRAEAEHWSDGNARRVAGSLQWQKFPLPFYGIGDRSLASAEETFTPTGAEAIITVQQRITGSWYATAGVRHLSQAIALDSAGVLRQRTILGTAGGRITEWSAGLTRDTRDNLFAPRQGRWLQASYARSIDGLWADYAFGTLRVDARQYHQLAAEHVIATQLQIVGVDGAAPFDQLALIGNSDIMRGYARGRYRDRWMSAAQGEYRSPVRHRVGGVLFGGAGVSVNSLGVLSDARLLPTVGAGLRVQIDQRQRTGVRLDYARGLEKASGLYIGFNQAF